MFPSRKAMNNKNSAKILWSQDREKMQMATHTVIKVKKKLSELISWHENKK